MKTANYGFLAFLLINVAMAAFSYAKGLDAIYTFVDVFLALICLLGTIAEFKE
jgi:hypothetical protein